MGTWTSLSAEQQQVLVEEAARLQDDEIALTAEVGAKALEELRTAGMKVNEADVETFRARMEPVYEDFKAKHGAELLEAVQNTGS